MSTLIISAAQAQTTKTFEVETDHIAYALGGASGHIALAYKNKRMQFGLAQLQLPVSFQSNKDLVESFKSISLKYDYFFSESSQKGYFLGGTFDYLFLTYTDIEDNVFKKQTPNIGLRTGYKFSPFNKNSKLNNLYLTPWVGFSYQANSSDFELNDANYVMKAFNVFPTVHLGWAFL